jgi:hypothetical protein
MEGKMSDVLDAIEMYKQWMIGATKPRSPVLPKETFKENPERNYNLKGKAIRKYLQHEKQTFGINLGWTDNATNETGNKVARWFFVRNGQSEEPIRFGETIALGNGGDPSFLRYEERPVGINLGWSKTPVFEWKLLGGKIGDPVYTQEWIAIYNSKAENGECLIFFDRTVGGDIGWPSSKTWGEQFGERFWKEVKEQALKVLLTAAAA